VFECGGLYVDAHCHGGALHQMSAFHAFCAERPYAFFFSVLQYRSDIIVTPYCVNFTISTPFLSQKMTVLRIKQSKMQPRFHHSYDAIEKLITIFVKSKPKPFCVLCTFMSILEPRLRKTGARGSVVVKALCYKPEGRGSDSRWREFLNLPNPSGHTRPWDLLSP
jgi:hypothetical protein